MQESNHVLVFCGSDEMQKAGLHPHWCDVAQESREQALSKCRAAVEWQLVQCQQLAEVRRVQQRADQTVKELDAERARREELEHAMQTMQRELLRLQQSNAELGGVHAACGPAILVREAEIERLKQAIAEVEEKLSKVETSREEERAAHKAQVEEERQRLAALREEHRNMQSALGRLWQLQSEAEWQLAEMRSEVDKLQHELSSAPRAPPVDARIMLQKWQVPIILGKGGTIQRRIQRASGAQIEVKEADGDRFACVELRGAQQQCRWDRVLCGV